MNENRFFIWRAFAFGLALVTMIDFIKDLVGPTFAHSLQMSLLVLMPAVVLWKTGQDLEIDAGDDDRAECDDLPSRETYKQRKHDRYDSKKNQRSERHRQRIQQSASKAHGQDGYTSARNSSRHVERPASVEAFVNRADAGAALPALPEAVARATTTSGEIALPAASDELSTRCPSSPAATTPRNSIIDREPPPSAAGVDAGGASGCISGCISMEDCADIEVNQAEFTFSLDWRDVQESMPYRSESVPDAVIDEKVAWEAPKLSDVPVAAVSSQAVSLPPRHSKPGSVQCAGAQQQQQQPTKQIQNQKLEPQQQAQQMQPAQQQHPQTPPMQHQPTTSVEQQTPSLQQTEHLAPRQQQQASSLSALQLDLPSFQAMQQHQQMQLLQQQQALEAQPMQQPQHPQQILLMNQPELQEAMPPMHQPVNQPQQQQFMQMNQPELHETMQTMHQPIHQPMQQPQQQQQFMQMMHQPQQLQQMQWMQEMQSMAQPMQYVQPMQAPMEQPMQYIPFGPGYITLPVEGFQDESSWDDGSSWGGRSSWRGGSSRKHSSWRE